MSLKKYRSKRKFSKTPEPKGELKKKSLSRFVVQEHHARNLHYDFRLEYKGVLKSWAVPKGVPEKKGVKRLAVQVEDHPVDYIDFSGIIPEGEYGAGEVKIWDKGKWKLISGDLKNGSIKFELSGKKLKGEYALIRFKNIKNWLIFKIGEVKFG
ncbi:3'-phosphoesterase [Candidatus Parcubacteria bacterium]|nr:3'-phosphoesterase [Candidatus Parcubacteria bacterium]